MLTRQDTEAIYDAGKETVVRVLLRVDARIHSLEQQVQDLTTCLDLSDKYPAIAGKMEQTMDRVIKADRSR